MKSRLRHPIRAIREPFGKAGLIVACIALVFAMVGGAYAASGGLTKSQEKQVKKIVNAEVKKHPGPAGPAGATGPAGPKGEKGDTGSAGGTGPAGTSVTGTPIPASPSEPKCNHQGGTAYTSASGTENVCNGQTGFTKTLPGGETEKGMWGASKTKVNGLSEGVAALAPISFVIPLTSAPTFEFVEEEGGETEHCPGTVENPKAAKGFLCLYASTATVEPQPVGTESGETQVSAFGAIPVFASLSASIAYGTWAVTAP